MTTCFLQEYHQAACLNLQQFPPFQRDFNRAVAGQIAEHVSKIMENAGNGQPITLRIPAAMQLAGLYQCTALDILDALHLLLDNHYEYKMKGLDAEITIYGPTLGRQFQQCLPEWLHPWDKPHPMGEKPLICLFHEKGE